MGWRTTGEHYRVTANLSLDKEFKDEKDAVKYLEEAEAKLKEANKLADGEIWLEVEKIYETRYDCPTGRLVAACTFLYPPQNRASRLSQNLCVL